MKKENTTAKEGTLRTVRENKISQDDLFIDISKLDNVNLAICAAIVTDHNQFTFHDAIKSYSKRIEMQNGSNLNLICNIFQIETL